MACSSNLSTIVASDSQCSLLLTLKNVHSLIHKPRQENPRNNPGPFFAAIGQALIPGLQQALIH